MAAAVAADCNIRSRRLRQLHIADAWQHGDILVPSIVGWSGMVSRSDLSQRPIKNGPSGGCEPLRVPVDDDGDHEEEYEESATSYSDVF